MILFFLRISCRAAAHGTTVGFGGQGSHVLPHGPYFFQISPLTIFDIFFFKSNEITERSLKMKWITVHAFVTSRTFTLVHVQNKNIWPYKSIQKCGQGLRRHLSSFCHIPKMYFRPALPYQSNH